MGIAEEFGACEQSDGQIHLDGRTIGTIEVGTGREDVHGVECGARRRCGEEDDRTRTTSRKTWRPSRCV